jgi:hypothetical protein
MKAMACQYWECVQLRQSLGRFNERDVQAILIMLLLAIILSVIQSIREDFNSVDFRSAVGLPAFEGGSACLSHSPPLRAAQSARNGVYTGRAAFSPPGLRAAQQQFVASQAASNS